MLETKTNWLCARAETSFQPETQHGLRLGHPKTKIPKNHTQFKRIVNSKTLNLERKHSEERAKEKKKKIIDSLSTVSNLRILIIFLKTPIFIFPQWFNPGHDVKKKKNKCGCKTRGETAVIHTISSTDRRLCEGKEILNNQAKGLGWFLSYGFYLSL